MSHRKQANNPENPSPWRKLALMLLTAAALAPFSAASDDLIWIGQPTARDYMAYNLQRGIEQFAELSQQMAQFDGEIEAARRAYFAAPAAHRAEAGNKFGALLFQKDLLIAMGRVVSPDPNNDLASSLMALANGGRPPDGGIPPIARREFNDWVTAIQMHAGTATGRMANPVQVALAIKSSDTLDEYQAYRRIRDQAEWDEFEAMRAGGKRRLLAAGALVSPKSYFGSTPMARGFDDRIARLPNKILQCEYAGRQADSSVFHFWHDRAPDDIGLLMAMQRSAFAGLNDHAAAECPADSKLASALASAPAKVVITPQMLKDARQQRNTGVPDPAQARIMADRTAQLADRRQAQQARATIIKGCSDNLKAQSRASSRDRYAMQAAHADYKQCMNAARE